MGGRWSWSGRRGAETRTTRPRPSKQGSRALSRGDSLGRPGGDCAAAGQGHSGWLAAGRRRLAGRATRAAGISRLPAVAMVTRRGGGALPEARGGSGAMAAVWLLLLTAMVGGDDSDWVRLPSKCEGE